MNLGALWAFTVSGLVGHPGTEEHRRSQLYTSQDNKE